LSFYAATKAAMESLTRGWAHELGAAGHTVNVMAPALTETDVAARILETLEEQAVVEMQKMLTPLEHRLGKPDDIALAVAMLADPASQWITGQSIQAEGGIYMA
jgi:3-oxoacyl-[acyl-carrier protein] reductase